MLQENIKDYSTSTHEYISKGNSCSFIPKAKKIDQVLIYLCGYSQTHTQVLDYDNFASGFPENTKVLIFRAPKRYFHYKKRFAYMWFNASDKSEKVVDILPELDWSEFLASIYWLKSIVD